MLFATCSMSYTMYIFFSNSFSLRTFYFANMIDNDLVLHQVKITALR